MNSIFYIFIFIFGLMVGSFLNCVIYRLERGEGFLRGRPRRKASFLWGRSYCPHCEHTLSWKDLIPVLSFVFLRGLCRYCGKKISRHYPLVEIATGLLFVLIFLTSVNNYAMAYLLTIGCFLIVIFVYDLKHYIIPDKVIYPAIGLALISNSQFLISNQSPIFKLSILSALGAAGFFSAIVLISRGRWMGAGDIKLAFLMGLILGWPNILVAMFLAFIIGAIIGVGLIILGKKKIGSEVPFGPFLVGGTFISLFWGQQIIDWYFNLCAGGLP